MVDRVKVHFFVCVGLCFVMKLQIIKVVKCMRVKLLYEVNKEIQFPQEEMEEQLYR